VQVVVRMEVVVIRDGLERLFAVEVEVEVEYS